MSEYTFDASTRDLGVVQGILNQYKGDDIFNDVVAKLEGATSIEADSFLFEDEGGDSIRFFVYEPDGKKEWTYMLNSDFE
jgi:hypothetical protein